MFSRQGAPARADGALRAGRCDLEALRAAAACCLSPAGQLQVATALEVLAALEARLEELRHELPGAARHLAGARVLAALHLPGRGVEIVERELLPVDIQPAYDGHRDLLKLQRGHHPARMPTQSIVTRLS